MIQLKFKSKELEDEYLENLQVDLKHTGLDIEIKVINDEYLNALKSLLDYLEEDEFKHYEECDEESQKNHIYLKIKEIKKLIENGN